MKISRPLCVLVLASASAYFLPGCGKGTGKKDALANVEAALSLYMGNAMGAVAMPVSGTTGTTKSNRPVHFMFNNALGVVTKLEVTRVINGASKTCSLLDDQGKPSFDFTDWAGATTEYTFNASALAADGTTASRAFGPYTITVEPAGIVINSGAKMHDQADDMITEGGPFFATREYAIGFGGYSGPNFNTLLAKYNPRLIDFATLTTSGGLQAVSPDLIQTSVPFPALANDCGYQTTTFAAYAGALDPSLPSAPLSAADITALPDPPATATTFPLATGSKFVYRTSDGKKGLVHIDTVTMSGGPVLALHFAVEQ